ncbi:MOSC domain-containing protein [Neobacillus sp. 19]|uniref:MOSC domain-containing protein n=1 Tax=Neobacillus sp. 19 TaxID=3394458 RepID=UPI003BF65C09
MEITLNKVFVGLPKTIGSKEAANPMDREWTSAIFKEPVDEAIWVGKTGLTGDGQGDLKHHGGPEKAVFAYSLENYSYWQKELGNSEIGAGGMGENLVMEGLDEGAISIGDTFQIGEAVIQVSQPRQPCWKPARRFKVKNLALLLQNTGKTGWYFRVVEEGNVESGQTFTLLDRPFPQWTIKRCNQIIHAKPLDFSEMRELAQCQLLAPGMRETLAKRIEKQNSSPDIRDRVFGPNE